MPGLAAYGWWHIIQVLAGYDITKIDSILDTNTYVVFNHLTYNKDRNDLEVLAANRHNDE